MTYFSHKSHTCKIFHASCLLISFVFISCFFIYFRTSPSDWDNLPEMDELKKLIITLPEKVPKIAGIGEGKKDSISFANSSVKRGILSSPSSRGGSRPSTSYHSRPSSSLSSRPVSSPVTSSFSPSPVTPPFSSSPSPSLPLIRSVSALSCTAHPILKNLNVTNTHAHMKTNTITRNNDNNSNSNSNNSNSNGSQELQAEALGGIVTWSLLTMTNENQNEGGYLLSLPRGVGDRAGARREIWCVLVDRIFHNFASHETLKPRFQTDLRHCTVTAFEGGVFALESVRSAIPSQSFKALYFMGRNKREGAKWFWKLYYQSASNNIVKYSNLNFRPGECIPSSTISSTSFASIYYCYQIVTMSFIIFSHHPYTIIYYLTSCLHSLFYVATNRIRSLSFDNVIWSQLTYPMLLLQATTLHDNADRRSSFILLHDQARERGGGTQDFRFQLLLLPVPAHQLPLAVALPLRTPR